MLWRDTLICPVPVVITDQLVTMTVIGSGLSEIKQVEQPKWQPNPYLV